MALQNASEPSAQEAGLIVSADIRLAPPARHFAPALYEIIARNRDYFSAFMAWPLSVRHESDTADFLDASRLAHQRNKSKTYIIVFRGKPAGLLSFNCLDNVNKSAEIGYWLDKAAQGKGIMTQSVQTLTRHYAERHKINRFVIKCSTANIKSNAIAKNCGFIYEGTLRQAEYLNGCFHDQNIYSLLAADSENSAQ